MIGFDLTEEQLSYRQGAREFAETQMKPYAAELDRHPDTYFDWVLEPGRFVDFTCERAVPRWRFGVELPGSQAGYYVSRPVP